MPKKRKETECENCRLCLRKVNTVNLKCIFEKGIQNISDAIFESTSIFTSPDDKLPQKICINCEAILKIVTEFKAACLTANQFLVEGRNPILEPKDWLHKDNKISLRRTEKLVSKNRKEIEDYYSIAVQEIRIEAIEGLDGRNCDSMSTIKSETLDLEKKLEIKDCKDTFDVELGTEEAENFEQFDDVFEESQDIEKPMKINRSCKNKNNGIKIKKPRKQKYHPEPRAYCHICGKEYTKRTLIGHINLHMNHRPFLCKVEGCDKTFTGPRQLAVHHKIHNRKIVAVCSICGKGFINSTKLGIHMSYHLPPTIPCTICGKLLRNKVSVKQHMIVHQTNKPHTCEVCNKSFAVAKTLRIHMRIHTNEKPFPCTMCDMKFAYNCLLKNHKEKYHT